MFNSVSIDSILSAVAGGGAIVVAVRLGAYKALKADLQTYKDRVSTLEAELAVLKEARQRDQAELAHLRERTDLTPILDHLKTQTALLQQLCKQGEEHERVVARMEAQQTALATAFSESLRPVIQQAAGGTQ